MTMPPYGIRCRIFWSSTRALWVCSWSCFPDKTHGASGDIEAGVRFDVLFLDVLMPASTASMPPGRFAIRHGVILSSSLPLAICRTVLCGRRILLPAQAHLKDSFFRLTDAVLAECRKRTQHSLILRCKSGVTRITLDSLEYCEVQGRTLVFHLLGITVIESSGSMDELARHWQITRAFCARTAPIW